MGDWSIQVDFPEKNEAGLRSSTKRARLVRGDAGAYFTVDIYPESNPVYPRRHFGTWQFPLLDQTTLDISVTPQGAALFAGGMQIQPSSVIEGRLKTEALYKINLAVSARDYTVLADTSYFQIIADSPLAVNPLDAWPGSSQREPRMTEPAYLSLKSIAAMLVKFGQENRISRGTSLLDVGCAHKPYYPFFAPTGCRYTGIDIFDGQFVDAVWEPASPMPFADAAFDIAISTQVLEHVPDPERVVAEIHRVLKPAGKVFLSAPFAWERHDYPGDYWRFSEEGLRKIFSVFSDCRITPNGNSRQCFTELRNLHTHRTMSPGFLRDALVVSRNWFAEKMFSKSKDFAMPSNFVVVATK
jgi:SAM-dependent methyltransferase